MSHSTFVFETEFTPDGDVLGGPERKYLPRQEVEKMAAAARIEGEMQAKQSGEAKAFAQVDRLAASLSPVQAQLVEITETLRREAAELALIAARRIAGDALDAYGETSAAKAIAEVVRLLKANPVVTITAAPDALPVIERRMEQLRQQGHAAGLAFSPDAAARPGDWRVEWLEGSSSFNRDEAEAALDAILASRLSDPVEPQLDLFSAA